jgi:hypothetical protein
LDGYPQIAQAGTFLLFTMRAAIDARQQLWENRVFQTALKMLKDALSWFSPLKPTVVFKAYWHFAAERQEIFFRRRAGDDPPWTSDQIMQDFSA